MSFHAWISDVLNVLQALAIVGGATWAYYKFFRGRTFARRAQLSIEGDLLTRKGRNAAHVRLSFRNSGASDIPLRAKALFVDRLSTGHWNPAPDWEQVAVVNVLADDDWLEGGEEISDEVLVPLPDQDPADEPFAYKARCVIYDRRRKPGGLRWTAEAIIPIESAPKGKDGHGDR
jgi:hypothetical protein